jgi:hypothetical protein
MRSNVLEKSKESQKVASSKKVTIDREDFKKRLTDVRKPINAEYTDIKTAFDGFAEAVTEYMEPMIQEKDIRRFPSDKVSESIIGNKLIYIAENMDREKAEVDAKSRTREEWEKLEEQYSADYVHMKLSWEDVESDLFDDIDDAKTSEEKQQAYEDYLTRITEYRQCEYVLCDGLIPHSRHGNSRYCCEDHKWAQENAQERYDETSKIYAAGTYLPEDYYIPKRGASVDKQYKKKETSRQTYVIEKLTVKREEEQYGEHRRSEKQKYVDVALHKRTEYEYYSALNEKQPVTPYNLYDLGIEELDKRGLSQYLSLKSVK